MTVPESFLKFVDTHSDDLINRLAEAVAIPSISGNAAFRPEVVRMSTWLATKLQEFGVETQAVPLGEQTLGEQSVQLPPVILGRIGSDPRKRTVLVYGHYDVQPAQKSDGWNTEPFELVVDKEKGIMFGRGSTDDKGPVVGWLNVLAAHKALGLELPVNLRFCFEGMEESSSVGLDGLIAQESSKGKDGWFDNVDCVCICDNNWLNTRTPTLTYGIRGISYFAVTVTGPGFDLHSGIGGAVYEPLNVLVLLMSKLVTPEGRILIPGIYDGIPEVNEEELQRFQAIDYSMADVDETAGGSVAVSDDTAKVLMAMSRDPSLSLHGFEGAYSGPGGKTVIPGTVTGKFSIRLVPPQTPEDVKTKVVTYLEDEFAKLKTKLKLKVELLGGGKPWAADPNHWNFEAAKKATELIYKKTPNYTREGGSIPVTLTFAENLGVNVLLLPMGRGDDAPHSTNEKLDISNYINGTKLLGAYLYEVGNTQKS
ncbi:Zn-dependent exopeptidase [Panus rudis PR-1116 ss-1]|nr:Zn-dependent exopeptidase [Panus rudis PR-1116 ss-1]